MTKSKISQLLVMVQNWQETISMPTIKYAKFLVAVSVKISFATKSHVQTVMKCFVTTALRII